MIGYPNKKNIQTVNTKPSDNHIGRGMSLEKDLNDSNAYYRNCDRALIHKKPTPIQVVKVDYPARNAAKIIMESIAEKPLTLRQRKLLQKHPSLLKAFIRIKLST